MKKTATTKSHIEYRCRCGARIGFSDDDIGKFDCGRCGESIQKWVDGVKQETSEKGASQEEPRNAFILRNTYFTGKRCIECGTTENLTWNAEAGGYVCSRCRALYI